MSKLVNILKNIRDRGFQDITDPKVIRAYMEWSEIEKNGIHLDASEIVSFSEQIVYRMRTCPGCVAAGECTTVPCHCPIMDMVRTPLAHCKAGFWDAMLPPEEWEEYKKEKNIVI